jgi:tetratricopeptide (TPR) repeat protein
MITNDNRNLDAGRFPGHCVLLGSTREAGRCGFARRPKMGSLRFLARLLSYQSCLVAMWCVLSLNSPLAKAQTATSTAPAEPPSPALADLKDIAEVTAGMSTGQLIDLAQRLGQASRWEDAEKILTEIIRREPRNLRAYQVIGQLYIAHATAVRADANIPDAAARAETLIDQAVKTYLEYGAPLALELNDVKSAEEMYRTVLRYPRHMYNPKALLGIARVLKHQGSMQAIDRYKTYINPRLCPEGAGDPQAHLELGQLYRQMQYWNQAVNVLEKAQQLDPENAEILLELATAYQDTRLRAKAIGLARKAVEKNPNSPAYRDVYAQILLEQSGVRMSGEATPEEGRRMFREARGESTEAVRLARAAAQAAPGDPAALQMLRNCFRTLQDILSITARLNPADVSAMIELARCQEELLSIDHTLGFHGILRYLLSLDATARDNLAYLETVADLQVRLNLRPQAAETARELLKKDPANAMGKRILEHLSREVPGPATATSTAPAVPR